MAMNAIHVTVDDDGTEHTDPTSMCTALYNAKKALAVAQATKFGQVPPVAVLKGIADAANCDGTALVTYFQANAVARVGASQAGLQKTPNPNNPNVATAAPGVNVDLPIL